MGLDYFQKRVIYYYEILSDVTKEKAISEETLCQKLEEFFCLNDEKKKQTEALLFSDGYRAITSPKMLRIHKNAITSFCYQKGFFGDKDEEFDALLAKENAYLVLTMFAEEKDGDFADFVSRRKNDLDCFATLYGLMMYFDSDREQIDLLNASLRKFIGAKPELALDARLLLLKTDEEGRQKTFDGLKKVPAMLLKTYEVKTISTYYGLTETSTAEKGKTAFYDSGRTGGKR